MADSTSTLTGKSTYLAAKQVAKRVESHFAKHQEDARLRGEQHLAPAPTERVIEAIIDTAFWASLRREEGLSPKISLAFLPPEQAGQPLLLKQRLPLVPHMLTKIAPGVERAGIHLGVWAEENELYVWGTTRQIPDLCFVLDVSEPGLLVIKHRRLQGFGKYINVAVLTGDQVKMVDEASAKMPDCPHLLSSLLGLHTSRQDDSVNVLIQLAVSMRSHGHGGTLLVVPAKNEIWLDSIIQPIKYAIEPPFTALADLMKQNASDRSESIWKGALQQEIDKMAGFTAVDGATIINERYELLAFGAKIARKKGATPVDRILVTEPVLGRVATEVHPSHNGGTRHLSAAQFVHDQQEALALVASQDGRFTIFSWSVCDRIVQAHQIETLLL